MSPSASNAGERRQRESACAHLNIKRVHVAARHQNGEVVMTSSDDVSGAYRRIRRNVLFCEERSLYIDTAGLSKEAVDIILNGKPARLPAWRFS